MAITEKLIEVIKSHPVLYDVSNEDFGNLRKKDQIWRQIGSEFKLSGEEVKKKWKGLKDTYLKYIKNKKARWRWAEEMEAFRPFMSFTKSSFDVIDISEENNPIIHARATDVDYFNGNDIPDDGGAQNALVSKSSPAGSTSRKRKILTKPDLTPTSVVEALINYLENKRWREMDPTELLFLAHANTVKTFSRKRQAITKLKIAQVIMEQEILHLEEVSPAHQHVERVSGLTNNDLPTVEGSHRKVVA